MLLVPLKCAYVDLACPTAASITGLSWGRDSLEVAAHTIDVECLRFLGAGAQVQHCLVKTVETTFVSASQRTWPRSRRVQRALHDDPIAGPARRRPSIESDGRPSAGGSLHPPHGKQR